MILRCFKEEQEWEVGEAQRRVRRRCRSLHVYSHEVGELRRKEEVLRRGKKCDYGHLQYVKKQLAVAVLVYVIYRLWRRGGDGGQRWRGWRSYRRRD